MTEESKETRLALAKVMVDADLKGTKTYIGD
jgi:hypothetical protein